MEESSAFSTNPSLPEGELLPCGGSTCDCYRVKLYGKLHFKKQLKAHLRTDPRYISALQKEFETGYRLEHPHLVRYIAKGEDYILTEYVDGETLGSFITTHPEFFLHRENADRFLKQLLDVVAFLHEHQVLHLDLKPSNIMMTRVGHELKLIDLGYCYTDTYTDTTGYTSKYAAPEQLGGSALPDTRTDIFAIGKILEQLPCAKRYAKVIKKCTADDPDMRYLSVSDMERQTFGKHVATWPWILALLFILGTLSFYFFQQKETTPATSQAAPQAQEQAEIQKADLAESTNEPKDEKQATNQAADIEKTPTIAPHATPTQMETQTVTPQTSATSGKAPEVKKVDIYSLRKELQKLCLPIFNQQLAPYRDSSYNSMGFLRFNRLSSNFQKSVNPLFYKLWEEKYKATGGIYEAYYYHECSNTFLYYVNNLYYDMMRNDDPITFADSAYHYPPVPTQ